MVGATGFEPAASYSRSKRSTKLSHAPTNRNIISYYKTDFKYLLKGFYHETGILERERIKSRNE